jgi:hypothetical protein
MATVFVMTGKREGASFQLMNRYNFVNGVHLEENDDDAKLKTSILTEFYPCKKMSLEEYQKQTKAQSAQPVAAQPAPQAPVGSPVKATSASPAPAVAGTSTKT